MFLKNSMRQYVVLANLGIWHTEKFYHPYQHPPVIIGLLQIVLMSVKLSPQQFLLSLLKHI